METFENTTDPSVIIVGAGIAGLACAGVLERERVPYLLLEADERIGGRIKTDHVDGYQLDRGFQVLQAAPLPNPLKPKKRKLNGIWIAGEYDYVASIQWSLYSGRKTGENILRDLQTS